MAKEGQYAKTVTFPNKTILGLSLNFGQFDKPVASKLLISHPANLRSQSLISNPLKKPASSIEHPVLAHS
jgi:hypothetical protein